MELPPKLSRETLDAISRSLVQSFESQYYPQLIPQRGYDIHDEVVEAVEFFYAALLENIAEVESDLINGVPDEVDPEQEVYDELPPDDIPRSKRIFAALLGRRDPYLDKLEELARKKSGDSGI